MAEITVRLDDLCVGRRGGRIAIGRAGGGATPLFLDERTARWLAVVALPAMGLAPDHRRPPARNFDDREPSPALAAAPNRDPALF